MANKKDIKIIPRLAQKFMRDTELLEGTENIRWEMYLVIFVGYLILLGVITFLPIVFSLKVLGLIIGSFILIDLFRSLKEKI